MMALLSNLWTARVLVIIGFLAAYTPVGHDDSHESGIRTRANRYEATACDHCGSAHTRS